MRVMRFAFAVLVPILLVLGLLLSCAPKATPAPTPAPATPTPEATSPLAAATPGPAAAPAPAPPVAPTKPAWQVEWDKTLAEGKKEGKVVIYANIGREEANVIREAFKGRFGIEVESTAGRGAEISEKVLSERRAGLYLVDVFSAGARNSLLQLKTAGATAPIQPILILPDVLDPKLWNEGSLPFLDKEGHVIPYRADIQPPFFVNTQLVKEGEITSYKDLLNPRWKGKIVMNDPTVSGSGHEIFQFVARRIYNLDYWKEFVKLEPAISRDQRLPVEWVARGKYLLAIGSKKDVQVEFMKAGAPVKNVTPSEGTFITIGSSALALLNKAPHPNAARLFINWLLSKEGQTVISQTQLSQSARVDVSNEHLDPMFRRQPGVKYFPAVDEEYLKGTEEYMKLARDIFGPLTK